MARRPPQRPTQVDTIGSTSVADPATDRAITDVREALERLRQLSVAPTVTRLTLNAIRPVTTIDGSVYIDPSDGELYYRDTDGTVSQLSNQSGGAVTDTYGSRFAQRAAELVSVVGGSPINFTNGRGVGSAAGGCSFYVACPDLRRGDRLVSVTCSFSLGVGAGTTQIELKRRDNPTVSLGTASSAFAGGGDLDVTLTLGTPESISAARSYVVLVTLARSQDSVETITVEYDRT